jgi:hypothetical protein
MHYRLSIAVSLFCSCLSMARNDVLREYSITASQESAVACSTRNFYPNQANQKIACKQNFWNLRSTTSSCVSCPADCCHDLECIHFHRKHSQVLRMRGGDTSDSMGPIKKRLRHTGGGDTPGGAASSSESDRRKNGGDSDGDDGDGEPWAGPYSTSSVDEWINPDLPADLDDQSEAGAPRGATSAAAAAAAAAAAVRVAGPSAGICCAALSGGQPNTQHYRHTRCRRRVTSETTATHSRGPNPCTPRASPGHRRITPGS